MRHRVHQQQVGKQAFSVAQQIQLDQVGITVQHLTLLQEIRPAVHAGALIGGADDFDQRDQPVAARWVPNLDKGMTLRFGTDGHFNGR